MKIAWATDLHLNFVDPAACVTLAQRIEADKPDVLLVGGDTGQSDSVFAFLNGLADYLPCPTYYVLGNHDFYGSSIAQVKKEAKVGAGMPAYYLPLVGPVRLKHSLPFVGVGGWGDARNGDFMHSRVQLNDYTMIEELSTCAGSKAGMRAKMRLQGHVEAEQLREQLSYLTGNRVVVLTHVPPFPGACWHKGKMSEPEWLPMFTCRAVGEVLLADADANPQREYTVLCGHSHGRGSYTPLSNLTVLTGAAEYGRPTHRIIEV